MLTAAAVPDLGSLLFAFGVNLAAIIVFAVLMFFRRYTKPGLTVVFVFFNVGLFAVVTVIMRTEINAAVGFGLFAMLSIIRLRSDPFSPREIGYFFGALALGLINGLTPPDAYTLALNLAVVGTMYVVDHPRLFVVPPSLEVTFDRVIADPVELRRRLEERLGVHVREVTVSSIDYVRDIMELKVQYLPTGRIKGGTSAGGTSTPQRPAVARLPGLENQPSSRGARKVRPSPAPAPAPDFQTPVSPRVAAPVAATVAGRPAPAPAGAPAPAVRPPGAPLPQAADPSEPPVPGSDGAGARPVATAGRDPQAAPHLGDGGAEAAARSPFGPVPEPAAVDARHDPVLAPVAPPAVDSHVPGPVFTPGAGPRGAAVPLGSEASLTAPSRPAAPGPERSGAAPAQSREDPPETDADDVQALDKALGAVRSWIR